MKFLADGVKSDSCIAVPVRGKRTVTSGLVPHQLVKLSLSFVLIHYPTAKDVAPSFLRYQ